MEQHQYELMFNREENHWWYAGNRRIIQALLDRHIKQRVKILDAGCGTGKNMEFLSRYGNVNGIDINDHAIDFCKKRDLNVQKASVELLPFKDDYFDLVTSFEVLYHQNVNSWQSALKELSRVTKPGGLILIRVPAFKSLFGSHDIVVQTKHRFHKKELELAAINSGLDIVKSSYCNITPFFPTLMIRSIQRIIGLKNNKADTETENKTINKIMLFTLTLESKLININFPFGVSALCLAKKPLYK
ncbi:MAG: class I SAM-dependent methyltransferase [Nanoarchaeota archaeon]